MENTFKITSQMTSPMKMQKQAKFVTPDIIIDNVSIMEMNLEDLPQSRFYE